MNEEYCRERGEEYSFHRMSHTVCDQFHMTMMIACKLTIQLNLQYKRKNSAVNATMMHQQQMMIKAVLRTDTIDGELKSQKKQNGSKIRKKP